MPHHASPPAKEPPPTVTGTYRYAELGQAERVGETQLATECALAISYNGLNHAVMMVTPEALEDFVHGFTLTAGIIDSADEVYDLRLVEGAEAWRAEVEIASRAFWQLKRQRRQLAGSSGCGVCGVEALEQALPQLPALEPVPLPPAGHLQGLRESIAAEQRLARHSGALHAALFVDEAGEIRLCREDIGRHNALDKLIGALGRERLEPGRGFAVVTSRCGVELLHKAVRAGIGTLVGLSAPTALTVDWARHHHLNLIHLPHHSAARVYSPVPRAP
ncbi:formate dehydrogenase accessory sulfurtransferase FdhD [Azotobacter salinestris]|uniref:formate dehydrogenase accessory sulfurtransferase FdhD n=1 Tax=Azotobacter salinestris TaxID=69964 RepID=UPI001266B6F5|nr:formate dehydrogenase accessory sulfurtransferase FdhD [Azotobacter salinestris]